MGGNEKRELTKRLGLTNLTVTAPALDMSMGRGEHSIINDSSGEIRGKQGPRQLPGPDAGSGHWVGFLVVRNV